MAYIGRIVENDHPDAETERLIILFIRDDGRFVAFPESTKSSEVIGELAHWYKPDHPCITYKEMSPLAATMQNYILKPGLLDWINEQIAQEASMDEGESTPDCTSPMTPPSNSMLPRMTYSNQRRHRHNSDRSRSHTHYGERDRRVRNRARSRNSLSRASQPIAFH